jgi:Xaa-Pro aminopeptidase
MDTRKLPDAAKPTTAAHDPETPQALIDFMSTSWLEAPMGMSRPKETGRFAQRRAQLARAFPDDVLVIPAGEEKVRSNDTGYRFRSSSDFAYLLGPGEAGSTLVLEPAGGTHQSVLFVPAHNRGEAASFTDRVYGELWVGRHRGVDESQLFFGVDRCRPMDQTQTYIDELRSRGITIRNVDEDAELATQLAEMRLIKDDYEIGELRTCIEITKRGFEDIIRILPRARSEREVEAAFWSRARIEAFDVGYSTISAGGDHACTLHWIRGTGELRQGELLLVDAGVEAESLYTADVTRTLPIGGRYSKDQRTVYDLVFEAQRAAFAEVKPGNDFRAPHRAAMRVLAQGLIDLGVLKCSLDEALDPEKQYYRRYTLHGTSHMLGLDVHDCAKARTENYRYGKLKAGMVLTVEPGLYFQPDDATAPENLRGIGVRIEDDALVTQSGYENLTAAIPSAADAVEMWIAQIQSR